MKLKICGLKYPDNLEEVAKLQPDYIGFIFYRASKRYMGETLSAEHVQQIDKTIKKTGVFVNETVLDILDHVARYNLDLVQLHGHETPEECKALCKLVPVMKAFQINETFDFKSLKAYSEYCQYFLFDSASEGLGGSGKKFDHTLLNRYTLNIPYFISGGIDLDDIPSVLGSGAHGIDVNSRFEISPGLKNIEKLIELKYSLIKTSDL